MYYYINYTYLDFTVRNTSNQAISIDTKENLETMYLYDDNHVKYQAILNEHAEVYLVVRQTMERNMKIKFSKMYNPETRLIMGLKLDDVVLNYEEYKAGTEEKNKIELEVKI